MLCDKEYGVDWSTVLGYTDWTGLRTLWISMRFCDFLGSCNIGDFGGKQLGSLEWPNLESLKISK